MARYIDVDKFKDWTKTDHECCKRIDCRSVQYDCTDCYYEYGGAEDVIPIVHAEWERCGSLILACSNCHNTIIIDRISNYCPDCGAKMDQE